MLLKFQNFSMEDKDGRSFSAAVVFDEAVLHSRREVSN